MSGKQEIVPFAAPNGLSLSLLHKLSVCDSYSTLVNWPRIISRDFVLAYGCFSTGELFARYMSDYINITDLEKWYSQASTACQVIGKPAAYVPLTSDQ